MLSEYRHFDGSGLYRYITKRYVYISFLLICIFDFMNPGYELLTYDIYEYIDYKIKQ